MTVLTEQRQETSKNWTSHIELIAAFISGALIVAAWLIGKSGTESFSVALYIIAFLIGGFAKAKEGIEDTIKDKN